MSRARSGKKRVPAKDAARAKDAVRAEVRALVHGPSYMTFEDVVADFPMAHINTRPPHVSYTPWHLLEHMRIAQRDILEYIEDPKYRLPTWPDDYWPRPEAQADDATWKKQPWFAEWQAHKSSGKALLITLAPKDYVLVLKKL